MSQGQNVNKPSQADDTRRHQPPQGAYHREPSPPFQSAQRDPLQSQVDHLHHKMEEMSSDNRSSRDKIANIERMLSKAIGGPTFNAVGGPAAVPPASVPIGGARPKLPRPQPQPDVNDDSDRGRPKMWTQHGHNRVSPSQDSTSGNSSDSSDSTTGRRRKKKDKNHRSSKKKHTFKLNRFLPQEEKERPMTTDRLWFCHGSLMLELYKHGYEIEGLLQHNVFIAEKAATRAYVSSGIIKYDEAVREKAREIGPLAYSSGDMSLALRFLSTEYARPHSSHNQNNVNRSGNRRSGAGNPPPQRDRENRQGKVVCWLYNGAGCYYEGCRYPHACSRCQTPGHSQHNCRVVGVSPPPVHQPSGTH